MFMYVASLLSLVATLAIVTVTPQAHENVIVFQEDGRFGGWPANNGIWSWGNEMVVGYTLGYHKENPTGGHSIDNKQPSVPRLARSLDGGQTWKTEVPSYLDSEGHEAKARTNNAAIDFTQPNFAITFRMKGSSNGYSQFYWSNDRCKTWQGPFALPTFDRKGIFARTDYLINGPHDLTAFITASRDEGGEGWPLCIRTKDGGKTWEQQSWIGEQPAKGGYAIMPSTVRLSENELFTYIRCRSNEQAQSKSWWIEPYRSLDNGKTWTLEKTNTIDNAGNPPHMIKLKDGRLALTFGYRRAPFGIRARLSSDGGRTWTPDIILRDDADNWDLGYPRTVQREDGKLVTAYYFNDSKKPFRYIAATIWDADQK